MGQKVDDFPKSDVVKIELRNASLFLQNLNQHCLLRVAQRAPNAR
jgi:hypothetical protein